MPNVDFLHLYGPASLDALAVWYRLFGDSLESERTFGLIQHLGIIFAVYAFARVAGHLAATGAALVATVLVMTPIGLSALAWHGGVALGLWAVVFAARARATARLRDWWFAGGLAGLALGYRPDLVVAFARTRLRVAPDATRSPPGRAFVGLLPMWWHLSTRPGIPRSGAWSSIRSCSASRTRAARPPCWGISTARSRPSPKACRRRGRCPPRRQSATVRVVLRGDRDRDRVWSPAGCAGGRRCRARRRRLLIAAVRAGILPQAMQRPDSTHLAWVAMVSWSMLVRRAVAPLKRRRRSVGCRPATALVGLLMLVVCPFYTYRHICLHTRSPSATSRLRSWSSATEAILVRRPHRRRALNEMIPDSSDPSRATADRRPRRPEPHDLQRHVGVLPVARARAGHALHRDGSGACRRADSGLAEDIANADFLVLTNIWTGWNGSRCWSARGSRRWRSPRRAPSRRGRRDPDPSRCTACRAPARGRGSTPRRRCRSCG